MKRATAHILGITLTGVLAFSAAPHDCKGAAIPSADTFGTAANTFTIAFVDIGNPGNADDAGAGGGMYSSPYGGVPYTYRVAVTEVPQDWITKATNLGMTNVTAGAWTGSQPAAFMTWYEAAAFVNYLNTSTGHQAAYNLNGTATTMTLWSSAQAWQAGGENLFRHKDAYYFLPSEDEWYKAAFHKNDGATADYWDYATGSNSPPTAVASGTTAGTAVYNPAASSPAAVDNNGGLSPYGTRGQNGNVREWLESAIDGTNDSSSEVRRIRDGDWDYGELLLNSRGINDGFVPSGSFDNVGFRVASVVPEPSAALLMIGSGLMLLLRRPSRLFP
jgi:hypothetical protein